MNKYLNLITEEELTKLAYTRVSDRGADWPKDVLDAFYREFPSLINYDAQIIFKEKDESKGYGIGAIRISGLSIPVIIRDYRLAPLDVALTGGLVLPFTKESLASLITQKSAFNKLKPLEEGEISQGMFDPSLYAAAGGGIIPAIGTEGGYEKMAQWITTTYKNKEYIFRNNKKSMAIMSGKGNDEEKAKKLIAAGLMKKAELSSILDKLSGHITKEAKTKVLQAVKKLKKENESIKTVTEKIANMKTIDRIPDVAEAFAHKIERDIWYIYKTGQYRYAGIFGNSKVDDPVIIEDLEVSSIQNMPFIKTAAGEPIIKQVEQDLDKQNLSEQDLGVAPSPGDYGILKFADDEATLPFMVNNIRLTDRSFVIHGHDGFTPRNFYPLKGIEKTIDHEIDKYGTYVPVTSKFVRIDLTSEGKPYKFAAISNKVIKLDKLAYRLMGPVLEKYANKHDVNKTWNFHDTAWALIATGASENDIIKVAGLKENQEYEIQTHLRMPTSIDKISELVKTEISKYTDVLDHVNFDLIKVAAYLPTNTSVDAVLGLNFLSRVNLQDFIAMLPTYETVVSDLARLLIGIRMGFEKIPEEPVQKAMKELMKVIYFLRGVSNLQKV